MCRQSFHCGFGCTGALLCGAAGVFAGRQVTTHWSARHLMPYYGAVLVDARVAVDGNIISAAGVTAGLDGALALASLLRGYAAAQEIQLAIEYAPNPIFDSGTPESAPSLRAFRTSTNRSGMQGKRRRCAMRPLNPQPIESCRDGRYKPQYPRCRRAIFAVRLSSSFVEPFAA